MRVNLSRGFRTTLVCLLVVLTACGTNTGAGNNNPNSNPIQTASPTPFLPENGIQPTETPTAGTIWMASAVPDKIRQTVLADNTLTEVADPTQAIYRLDVAPASGAGSTSTWFYALVAPFATVPDGVSFEDLRHCWAGEPAGPFAGRPLWMAQSTLDAFTVLWGAPAAGAVQVGPADTLVDSAWADWPSWGIVPFEALQTRWKVLAVDGQSPIHKEFDASAYPLSVSFQVQPELASLPATNRDPGKMTILVMTGVTALVRATAARMEDKGVDYPAQDIVDWLRSADITHISNEVSFVEGCPAPNANSESLVFCSDPKYMELLKYVGTDVIELTGNHMNDWGVSHFRSSLDIYAQNGLPTFGGGVDLAHATQPLMIENNGNRLAFIGCDSSPISSEWATDTEPGSAPCGDYLWMANTVTTLRSQGYLPVATFQYSEYYTFYPPENMMRDFGRMADAGAAIVSGSQSHFPMAMEFKGNAFIHYGLGNLFFDQMNYTLADGTVTHGTRREFIDRYVIYDNQVISVELLTAMLEDYARPRPMTDAERAQMLEDIFSASAWR